MSQSASGSSSGDRSPRPGAAGQSPHDSRLFERVLQETAAAAEMELSDDADWQALLAVARRHPQAAFALDPVLIEMVSSLLRLRTTLGSGQPQDWQPMARRISQSLWNDQPSCERLESLWARLGEAAR